MRCVSLLPILIAIQACFSGHVPLRPDLGEAPSIVVLSPKVASALDFVYRHIGNIEWAACLDYEIRPAGSIKSLGYVGDWAKDKAYYVDTAILAYTTGNTSNSIDHIECKPGQGRVHSHPDESGRICYRSPTDRKSFWHYDYPFEIVWCGPNTYRWYTRNGEQGQVLFRIPLLWSKFNP